MWINPLECRVHIHLLTADGVRANLNSAKTHNK